MSRRIILLSFCMLIVTPRGQAQAANHNSAIAELQRQLDEMRSQMVKMQNRIAELEAGRRIAATNSSADPVLLQNQTPMAETALAQPDEAKSPKNRPHFTSKDLL
jgi:phage shock protein A